MGDFGLLGLKYEKHDDDDGDDVDGDDDDDGDDDKSTCGPMPVRATCR